MMKAARKEPTVKKIVNLSDELVEEIDDLAIGMYSNRSEFLTEAIRSFTRRRINLDRVAIDKLQEEYSGDELACRALERSQNALRKLKRASDRYESDDVTPISVYITRYQLDVILSCFVSKDGAVRNLQEYARIAAVSELRTMKMEREFADDMIGKISP